MGWMGWMDKLTRATRGTHWTGIRTTRCFGFGFALETLEESLAARKGKEAENLVLIGFNLASKSREYHGMPLKNGDWHTQVLLRHSKESWKKAPAWYPKPCRQGSSESET